MKKYIVFFLLYSLNIFNITIKSDDAKLILKNVTEGVYNIIVKKKFYCLTYIAGFKSSREKYGNSRLNFRFTEVKNKKINTKDNDNKGKKYFTIRHIYSNNYVGVKIDKNNINSYRILGVDNIITSDIFSFEWEFIKIEENVYLIKNKAGCFLKEEKNNYICSEELSPRTDFHLLKLFTEVRHTKEDLEIIEKEPIDVFIKYIDLSDPNLVREGIPQIKKDKDNEELRYCIRSILKNIPWVRKIFILMPNEKVRYFKDYEFINEKIVYVKDKDLLGYDSADSHAFQYRIWKMKEFGLSDNFIIMDDDYFIGRPLNKSDFFYVENNTVLPAIINTNYEIVTNISAKKELSDLKKKIQNNPRLHTSNRFMYSVNKAYLFLIQYFKLPLIVPYFTHNAIPANINDIKEIYDLIYNSEHRNATLFSLERHNETLQFQTSLIVYTFNKYKRKSHFINYNYIDNANTVYGKYNSPLYCINTGNNNDYLDISFVKTKLVMESLFPEPTKYEIFDSTIVPYNADIVIHILEKDLTELEKQEKLDKKEKEKSIIEKLSIEYQKCENKIDKVKAENDAYTAVNKKRKNEILNCEKNNEKYKEKIKELKNGLKVADIIELIQDWTIKNDNNIKKIKELKKENENDLKEINNLKSNIKEIYFIIYLELAFIIIMVIIIVIFYGYKRKKYSIYNNSNFMEVSKQINNKENKLFD